MIDINDRKALESLQKHELLGKVAVGAAHGLNNLFSILQAQSELAKLSPSETNGKQIVETAGRISQMGGRITWWLLDFATGCLENKVRTDLKDLVGGCTELLKGVLAPKNIEFRVELEDVPRIKVNVVNFQQLVCNLVLNAKNAVDSNGRIRLRLREKKSGIVLLVADNGPGIPPEIRERLFDPRVSPSRGNGRSGTGLGLSICRDIVRRHGGGIKVRSFQDGGTVFIVHIPISASPG